MQVYRLLIVLCFSASVTSCSLFDSGTAWRGGSYALTWIDTADNLSLCRDLGKGACIGRVDATVFAVGWNGRYAVAKQHPAGDRSKTDYFIVDSLRDSDLEDPSKAVVGPLSKDEYRKMAVELKLPDFTKVFESLE